ncbi:WD repeat-containing protein 13-like isoform X2 [Copidosoma floridanum]|nr:WD repeat-containing protein 13-like isoform X2 [Copidosoma floridanum]
MMYIRRRSQLLQAKPCKDPELQRRYLKLRSELLRRRYGTCLDTASLPSEKSFDIKGKDKTTNKRTAERFAGVHHVFDHHSAAISMLKFANNDRSRFCCASNDGTISICECTPPKVVAFLQGHQKGVTAIDWSTSNDLLVSSSLDCTVRLWKIHQDSKTDCLRITLDQSRAEVLCCVFVPTNNNFVLAGNSRGLLQTLNVSTGKFTKNGTLKIGGRITALSCEESGGSIVWAGNDRGNIISFRLEPLGLGKLTKLRRMEGTGGTITSLSWRPWLSKDFPWPTLLVSSACNAVLLFKVADDQGCLVSWKKYPIKHRQYFIRSTFCPQMAQIATGSEDGTIFLFDSVRDGKVILQGHSSATLSLSFNYDESLLASGDKNGLVILWRTNQA